ncbi:MAG: polymer-forming cytoskeletal protein [Candidatus Eisenbacteria bacterium]|nr:polymer-forming cytoskeletal protein [Candidatus Eisenbacteria bacterium]
MSASWGSESGWKAARRAAGLAVAAALLLSAAPGLAARQPGDSGQVVRRVRIGPAGIRIEETAGGESAATGRPRHHVKGVIKVGPRGVRIERLDGDSAESGGDVEIESPGLVVNAGNAGLVRLFADAEVPAGRRIEGDVVAVFGSVDVAGVVSGNVVAVFGSVRLRPGASVDGDVVAIGGVLDHPAGATVNGQSVQLGFFPIAWGLPTLPVLLFTVLVGWLLTLFMGWLLALVFPERTLRIAVTASRHTAGSFFLGVLSAPMFVIALVLLFITVIGIPLAFLLPLLYALVVWTGQIAASYVLGCKLTRRRLGQGGLIGPVVAGTLFVALFFVAGAALAAPPGFTRTLSLFFTLLGLLLVVGLSTIGTGALLLSRFGGRPDDVIFESGKPGSPVAAVPPAAAAGGAGPSQPG